MNNEYDISELNGIEFDEFCRELMDMNIPFRWDIMNRLYNGSNEYGASWKNRILIVKEVEQSKSIFAISFSYVKDVMNKYFYGKNNDMLDNKGEKLTKNEYKEMINYCLQFHMSDLNYNEELDRIECIIDKEYEYIIQSFSTFLENEDNDYDELIEKLDRKKVNQLLKKGILNINNSDVHFFFFPLYSPFLKDTILFGEEYDFYLREWLGNNYIWKLLYRASEHGYTAKSFHNYCDNVKGPTLVIMKSSEGWIFGGYATQSWSGDGIYYYVKFHD